MMHKRPTSWLGATGLYPGQVAPGSRSIAVRRLLVVLLLIPASMGLPRVAQAVNPNGQASASRESREAAIRGIPFQELDGASRQKLAQVVGNPSLYRRLPTRMIDCDPDMYLFLIRHPEVVVNIWDLMGVTNVQVQRTGPYTMRATDGAGTTTDIELVYGSRDRHVIFAEGYYEGPLLAKRMTGRCVLLLTSDYQARDNQTARVSSQLDVFLQLDNAGADLLARTLHPIVGRTADHNFFESAGFVSQLYQAAERNPAGMQRLANRLTLVDPAIRHQFAQLAGVVGERAVMRQDLRNRPGMGPMEAEIAVAELPAAAALPVDSLGTDEPAPISQSATPTPQAASTSPQAANAQPAPPVPAANPDPARNPSGQVPMRQGGLNLRR